MNVWKRTPKFLIPLFVVLFFLSLYSSKTMRAPFYEQWVWTVLSPFTAFFSAVRQGSSHLWRHYIHLVDASVENERMRKRLRKLEGEQGRMEALRQENERLGKLLALKGEHFPGAIAARVVAFDPRFEFRSLRINKGAKDGIAPNMPVIAEEGLVGKVGPVFAGDAYVLLVADPASHVDVVVVRSGVRTLLSGSGFLRQARLKPGYFLTRLEYLKKESDIVEGDAVVTTGLDRLYPSGLLAGTIEKVVKDRYGLFLEADVRPAVDFSKLREVLVLQK